jgi:hypothetical protein
MAQSLYEAAIDFVATGDNTVVSGGSSRIHKLFLVLSADSNLTFKDGATPLTGAMSMKANGAIVLDIDPRFPWFTPSGSFIINQSGVAQVSGRVYYSR